MSLFSMLARIQDLSIKHNESFNRFKLKQDKSILLWFVRHDLFCHPLVSVFLTKVDCLSRAKLFDDAMKLIDGYEENHPPRISMLSKSNQIFFQIHLDDSN